jgi:D-beta-D-heptose 7-phosphate kinase/D-beta-D-heptose 1-phosphate adenosyltransferase
MIVSLKELNKIRIDNKNSRIVLACGTFDIVHKGHIDYLEYAKNQGDILVVVMPNDTNVSRHKGVSRPINPEESRIHLINSLGCVDYAVLMNMYNGIIRVACNNLNPDIIVAFKDWPTTDIEMIKKEFPNTKVIMDKRDKISSTSSIIEKINSI